MSDSIPQHGRAAMALIPHLPQSVQRLIIEFTIKLNIPGHQSHLYGSNYLFTQRAIASWPQAHLGFDGFHLHGLYSPISGIRISGYPTMDIMKSSRFARLVGFEYFKRKLLDCSVHPMLGMGHREMRVRGFDEFIADLRFKMYGATYAVIADEDDDSVDSDESSGEIVPYAGQVSGDDATDTTGDAAEQTEEVSDEAAEEFVDDVVVDEASKYIAGLELSDITEKNTQAMVLYNKNNNNA